MTIQEMQDTVDEWIQSIGVRYFDELTNTAMLMEEVGELSRIMSRRYGEQSFKRKEDELNSEANMADEMADILFVLTCLANQTGVNLADALQKNLKNKARRNTPPRKPEAERLNVFSESCVGFINFTIYCLESAIHHRIIL